MRILLLVVYYPPSTTSAAQMMQDLAQEYVRQGHQVIVATPSDAIEDTLSLSDEEGVTVVRVRTGNMKHSGKVKRLWRESRLSAVMWRNATALFQSNACDLIVCYSPTIFLGGLVGRLKRLWRCPVYLILRDIFPKWAVDAGLIGRGLLYRYFKRAELGMYRAADVIGVEAPGTLSYFRDELGKHHFRVEVLRNWVDTREQPASCTCSRQRLGLVDKIIFFYGGNIGVAQDLDNILRLASGMRAQEDVFFLLIGSGSEVERLKAEIARQEMNNIRILPPLAPKEYLQCLAESDVGLVSLDRRLTSHNFPGKLLGYVLCGKPVLASLNPGNDLIQFLHQTKAGLACINGDDDTLRAAALSLATEPELRQRLGNNARTLGDTTFSVQVIAKQILASCFTAMIA
jgi:O26-antigen biosynthesis N-acetyl-L-fucosamine transferase